jgi:effector-binding domain-containing protein
MLKKILYVILGVVLLLVVIGFLLPGKFEISRTVKVNAPAAYSFEEVDQLENWNNWSYWNTLDTTMRITYGEKRSGEGASYSWTGEEVGNGKILITESIPHKSIKTDLDFMENGIAKSWYTFEPDGDSTSVTMGFSTDFGMNPFMRLMGATMFESEMDKAFTHNLQKIKELAENKPKFSVNITEEKVQPISYIGISHTMSPKDPNAVSVQMMKMYTELFAVLKKAKVEVNGHPFALFPNYTSESMDMVCAVPVAADAKLPAKYKVMQTTEGMAVKAVHTGSYNNLEATHNQIDKYMGFKKYELNGAPWEVYVTDPEMEKDTAKWITEIYYPIK